MTQFRDIRRLFVLAGLDILEKSPEWIKDHPEIKKRKDIKKVFPSFGLNNFQELVKYQNKSTQEQDKIIHTVLEVLSSEVRKLYQDFITIPYSEDGLANASLRAMSRFLRAAANALYTARTDRSEGKTKLVFDDAVELEGRHIFRKNEGIFSAFNKIKNAVDKFWKKYPSIPGKETLHELPPIDLIPAVKKFHVSNIPNKDYYVVFSATGEQGAWDICTMSMRGISSCQSWEGKAEDLSPYNRSLVGSVLSKYIGIIYLTTGEESEKYGSRMIARCLVRFAINSENKNEKVIILDQMYNAHDPEIAKLFVDCLQKRTPLKVLDYSGKEFVDLPFITNISVPGERTLWRLQPDEQPYKDIPFLAKQPTMNRDSWKNDLFETTRKFKLVTQEIYDQTSNDIDIDLVEQITDSIVGIEDNTKNVQKAALYGLNRQLHRLINRTDEMQVSYDLRLKYIHLKMNQFFVTLTRADLPTMTSLLNMDIPTEAERQPAMIRGKIDEVIHEYRMNFYNMFK